MGMNMQSKNIVLAAVIVALLPGCGMFTSKKKLEYKNGATQAQPLEVPPDLTAPETSQSNIIPGTDGVQVASYSEYAKQTSEQPCLSVASAPVNASPAAVPAAKLQEANGIKSIVLGEPFDRSWRRVGLALDRAHIKVTDKDRSKGIYFVLPAADKDKKKDKDTKPSDYLVSVSESSGASSVTVADQNGKSDADSARLLDVLLQGLNQENVPGDEVRPSR
jgi:outer membrane protein assembly factor BamC